ncbi:MAG: hypothetical protein JJU28_12445 [Cyclobacteriaceae bacterium]|nr:hypothetical protein [Cyclobacteriaceae bacterium]
MSIFRLILFIVILILLIRMLNSFFKVIFGVFGQPEKRQARNNGERGKGSGFFGNLKIDFMPKKKKSRTEDFKGGEYVDYEEINDSKK